MLIKNYLRNANLLCKPCMKYYAKRCIHRQLLSKMFPFCGTSSGASETGSLSYQASLFHITVTIHNCYRFHNFKCASVLFCGEKQMQNTWVIFELHCFMPCHFQWKIQTTCPQLFLVLHLPPAGVCLKDDGTGDGTLGIDCPGKDYRIGTLSKVNNIIYCKNDVLAE